MKHCGAQPTSKESLPPGVLFTMLPNCHQCGGIRVSPAEAAGYFSNKPSNF
ncbi:MAG: hypothetical protein ACTS43_01215 [Candidatus Hodgkinia cicadicola]